ncbi:MAG: autotransporter assembly complex protein TamA [Alphaproteobacteria bacterium]
MGDSNISIRLRHPQRKWPTFFVCFILRTISSLSVLPVSATAVLAAENVYTVVIQSSTPSKELQTLLEDLQNTLEARVEQELSDAAYMRYRFQQDRAYLEKFLEAAGYYQAVIQADFDETTYAALFRVDAGEQYTFGNIQLVMDVLDGRGNNAISLPDIETLNAKPGAPARAGAVLADEQSITAWVEKNNCLFEQRTSHRAIVNNNDQRVDITYHVAVGPEATIGEIQFSGHESIADLHLRRRVPLKPGDCFKRSKINDANVALLRSGLLAKAQAVLPAAPAQDGTVPVTFSVTESAHRSVKAGASFSTDIGPGVGAGWEHRNFLSHGEKFSTDLTLATEKQKLDTQLVKPFFLRTDQRLKLGNAITQENNDAFKTTGISFSGSVDRDFRNKWVLGAGLKYGFEQITDQKSKENFALFSVPLFASQDKRDDLLNPQSGWTFRFDTAPSIDTLEPATSFLKNRVSGTYYQPVTDSGRFLVAVRLAAGSIAGVATGKIPATDRFYTGGGGSIRGYGYQLAGPLDADKDPLGGRSFLELSTELRQRIGENYGVAAFIDGGNAFDAAYPDLSGGLQWGAGMGFRYYTEFGPIRADIAVPLNKRSGVDDAFQFYFSIGQAF